MIATLLPGRIAEAGESEFNSRVAEGAVAFGQALMQGTTKGKQVKAWASAGSGVVFEGIAMMTMAGDVDNNRYNDHQSVSALISGKPAVKVSSSSATVAPGDRVAIYADGHFGKGPLTPATNGVYGANLLNAVWKSDAVAGAAGVIQIIGPTSYTVVQL